MFSRIEGYVKGSVISFISAIVMRNSAGSGSDFFHKWPFRCPSGVIFKMLCWKFPPGRFDFPSNKWAAAGGWRVGRIFCGKHIEEGSMSWTLREHMAPRDLRWRWYFFLTSFRICGIGLQLLQWYPNYIQIISKLYPNYIQLSSIIPIHWSLKRIGRVQPSWWQ